MFNGNGGYDWETVYNMPIWLRKFTYDRIADFYKREEEATQNTQPSQNNNNNLPMGPDISPTYSTKASTK